MDALQIVENIHPSVLGFFSTTGIYLILGSAFGFWSFVSKLCNF